MDFSKQITRKVNVNYALMQSSFLCITATIVNFSIIYLRTKGLSNTEAGLTLSLAQIATIVLQPFLGSFADRHPNIPLKFITTFFLAIQAALCVLMMFINSPLFLIMILFMIISATLGLFMTLVNSLGMRYKNSGIQVNFSAARGVGALAFAISGYIIGLLIERAGMVAFMPITLFFIVSTAAAMLFSMRPPEEEGAAREVVKGKHQREPFFQSLIKIFQYNPATIFVFFSVMMISFNHIMMDTYQINMILDVGGNSEQYGLLILVMAACEVPPMLLLNRIAKKFQYGSILTFAFAVYIIKDIMIALSPNVTVLLLAQTLNLFSVGFYFTATVYYINDLVGKDQTVRGQALINGLSAGIGMILGTTVGGVIIDASNAATLFMSCAGVAALGALFMFISMRVNAKHQITLQQKAFTE